jgi:hypothetical protein
MNVKIEKSEFVEIEGLTEAAVASSDIQLIGIVNFAELATSYLPDSVLDDDNSMHPSMQLREACMTELMRRHGDSFDFQKTLESHLLSFSSGLQVSA